MKGIVLAGGIGSRLSPLTRVTNKHLLPVYDKPMIFYPLQILVDAGIRDILIVTGGHNAGDFLRLLQNGKEFGLQQLSFAYQEGEAGIADALRLAEPWAKGDSICVVLGDNIIEGDIKDAAAKFEKLEKGAMVMLKEVTDPERFGVPVFENERIVRIEEKPKKPQSSYAVIGVYFYDVSVFDRIRRLKPSGRGEYEITDVNNSYIEEGTSAPQHAGRLVDRRWHVRIAVARQQYGSRQGIAQRRRSCRGSWRMKLLITGGAGFIGSNFGSSSSTRNHGSHAGRDHATSDQQIPWDLVFLVPGPTWFMATSTIKPYQRPWCQGSRTPSGRGPDDSKAPGGQAASGNSAPSSHRPPWSLALMGPSSTRIPRHHGARVPHAACCRSRWSFKVLEAPRSL